MISWAKYGDLVRAARLDVTDPVAVGAAVRLAVDALRWPSSPRPHRCPSNRGARAPGARARNTARHSSMMTSRIGDSALLTNPKIYMYQ
jgi:hypothetical protein